MVKVLFTLISMGLGIGTSFVYSSLGALYQSLIALGFMVAYMIGLITLFFIQFFLEVFFENKKKKRTYQSKYFRSLLKMYDLFLFSLFGMKIEFSGKELLSKDETYMVICNHRSNLDSLVIDYYLKDFPLTFVAKDSLFRIPFVGKLIHGCAYICMDRKDIRSQINAIHEAVDFMQRKDRPLSVGIFPEGRRGSDENGLPNEFKAGSFQMALRTKKPIVVSSIMGTKEVNDNLLFKRHRVRYDIIKVVEYSEYKDMNTRELADYCNKIITDHIKEVSKS